MIQGILHRPRYKLLSYRNFGAKICCESWKYQTRTLLKSQKRSPVACLIPEQLGDLTEKLVVSKSTDVCTLCLDCRSSHLGELGTCFRLGICFRRDQELRKDLGGNSTVFGCHDIIMCPYQLTWYGAIRCAALQRGQKWSRCRNSLLIIRRPRGMSGDIYDASFGA